MNNNPFLKEFIEMRKSLAPPIQSAHKTPGGTLEKKKKKTPKPERETIDTSLHTIVEDRPPKKVLIEFLQNRANELTCIKMA